MTATDGTKIGPLTTSDYRFYSDYIWPNSYSSKFFVL